MIRAGDETGEALGERLVGFDGCDVRGYGVACGMQRVRVGGAWVADGGDEEGVGFFGRVKGGGGTH